MKDSGKRYIGLDVYKALSHRHRCGRGAVGVITAMTVLAAIGEIQRFESARHLASYSGLTPGLEQSGTKYREKGITKEGRKELRWALVEAA